MHRFSLDNLATLRKDELIVRALIRQLESALCCNCGDIVAIVVVVLIRVFGLGDVGRGLG